MEYIICSTQPHFFKRAYTHIRKFKVHGVVRKEICDIPNCVKQEEEKNRNKEINVRGVVKAAVLKGDPECHNLVASSVYDTKPAPFFSMVYKKVSWVVKERLVYNVDTGVKDIFNFLRMGYTDVYNDEMGDVDIAY